MTGRINKPITFVLTGAACVLFCTAPASAEFITFWKTKVCWDFPGLAMNGSVEGQMQAAYLAPPLNPMGDPVGGHGVGGVFCDTQQDDTFSEGPSKAREVGNADIAPQPGDFGFDPPDCPSEDCHWDCVVCNYSKPGGAIPAISALGTAVLLGGLLTAGVYQLRRRQNKPASA